MATRDEYADASRDGAGQIRRENVGFLIGMGLDTLTKDNDDVGKSGFVSDED